MRVATIATVLAGVVSFGLHAPAVHAAPPIQVNCKNNSDALTNLLMSGVVVDGDKLAISGTCVVTAFPNTFEITDSVILDGKGGNAALMGGGPVLTIAALKTVVVQDLSITGGNADGPMPGNTVAGVENNGTLTLIDSSVHENHDLGGPGSTGGIENNGVLTLINSFVTGNDVRSGGLPTGGILNCATCSTTLINSTVSSNTANTEGGPGTGGIHNMGLLLLSGSAVSENDAFAGGNVTGGIRNTGGTVVLLDSDVSKNTAEDGAVSAPPVGGIYNNGGTVSLSNSSVNGNVADASTCGNCLMAVGGIYNDSPGVDTLVLASSAVTENVAVGTGADVGGVASIIGVPLPNLTSSIVENNNPKDCNFVDPACVVAP